MPMNTGTLWQASCNVMSFSDMVYLRKNIAYPKGGVKNDV